MKVVTGPLPHEADPSPPPDQSDLREVVEVPRGKVHRLRVECDELQVLLVVLPTTHSLFSKGFGP